MNRRSFFTVVVSFLVSFIAWVQYKANVLHELRQVYKGRAASSYASRVKHHRSRFLYFTLLEELRSGEKALVTSPVKSNSSYQHLDVVHNPYGLVSDKDCKGVAIWSPEDQRYEVAHVAKKEVPLFVKFKVLGASNA